LSEELFFVELIWSRGRELLWLSEFRRESRYGLGKWDTEEQYYREERK